MSLSAFIIHLSINLSIYLSIYLSIICLYINKLICLLHTYLIIRYPLNIFLHFTRTFALHSFVAWGAWKGAWMFSLQLCAAMVMASYSADPERKKAASKASYSADPERRLRPKLATVLTQKERRLRPKLATVLTQKERRIPPMQFDGPIDFIMELSSTPHRPLMESSHLGMEVENAHLLMDAENPIAGPSAASSQPDPNPRIKRISIPRINISGLLEETALEPLPQQRDEDAQHHSSSVSILQAKISERMRSFRTSLIDMTRASHQRAVMRRALVSGDFPLGLTARIIPSMLKPNPEVLKEWELAHFAFSKRLAETLVHHYDLQIRKERDIQGYAQESIREAIENARLLDSDLEYIQRYWAEETEKASKEAKALAKKQAAHREKVQENRKRRKVDSTPPSTEHTPTPASGDTENSANLRAEINQLRQNLAKLAGNAGRGRGRGRGRGQSQQSRSGSRDKTLRAEEVGGQERAPAEATSETQSHTHT